MVMECPAELELPIEIGRKHIKISIIFFVVLNSTRSGLKIINIFGAERGYYGVFPVTEILFSHLIASGT